MSKPPQGASMTWKIEVCQTTPRTVECVGVPGKIDAREHSNFWAFETEGVVVTVEKNELENPPTVTSSVGCVLLHFKTQHERDLWIQNRQNEGRLGEINPGGTTQRDATEECGRCWTFRNTALGRECGECT